MNSFPDGTAPGSDPSLEGLEAGFLVGAGRYTLKRKLGGGAHSAVWQALDDQLGEEMALKFYSSRISSDSGCLSLLLRQAQQSRKLSHPHILRIHDLFHAPGELAFIAMEYAPGGTLREARSGMADRVFPWDYLQPLLEQACGALDYAHAEGLAHRNITPGNLMLDGKGRLKLADFGLPKIQGELLSDLSDEDSPQSLGYVSPQVLEGAAPGPLDDLYSLGAVFYEFLTGTPPFWRGDLPWQIRNSPPQPLNDRLLDGGIQNDIPPAVSTMIVACLAKDPAERPSPAGAIIAGMKAVRAPLPAPQPPATLLAAEPLSLMPPEEPPAPPAKAPPPDPWADAPEDDPEEPAADSTITISLGKLLGLLAGVLLVALGVVWVIFQAGGQPEAPRRSRTEPPAPAQPAAPQRAAPVINVGEGPGFAYRYEPRQALALDTNAVNSGVQFNREEPEMSNCCYIVASGTTNNSVGSITYEFEPAPGHRIDRLILSQSAALFTSGHIRGEYSLDGGRAWEQFFSTGASNGGYYDTDTLSSLNATNVLVRYTLLRYEGWGHTLQFLRDCDSAPAALEITGTVIPGR